MFNFNIKKTEAGQKYILLKNPLFKKAGLFKKISFYTSLVIIFFLVFGYNLKSVSNREYRVLTGLLILSLDSTLFFWLTKDFVETKLKKATSIIDLNKINDNPSKYNLALCLDIEATRLVDFAIRLARKNKVKLTSSILLLSLINQSKNTDYVLTRMLIIPRDIEKIIRQNWKQDENSSLDKSFQETLLESLRQAINNGHKKVRWGDILEALSIKDKIFNKTLLNRDLDNSDVENIVNWIEEDAEIRKERRKFWDYGNLIQKKCIGRDWASGYSLTLDRFSIDLTEQVSEGDIPFQLKGHNQEIKNLEIILSSPEINNALLVGQEGTGKLSIIKALAQRSFLGKTISQIKYKKFKVLNLPSIITQIDSQEKIEFILNKIFEEIYSAGNIILVIENLFNYVGVGNQPGRIDISGIIIPFLKLPQFRVLATSNYVGLHKNIERNQELSNLFKKVEVKEISPQMTIRVLEDRIPLLEYKYKKLISYKALKEIVDLANRYFPSKPFPRKAINILQDTIVYAVDSTQNKIILPAQVDKVVSLKTEIPIGKLKIKEKEILSNLEALIHRRIINQQQAVSDISAALRRARTGIESEKRPIGNFLFLGPTGVGKTETAKALAAIYFGSEKNMIRLDMSEFQSQKDIVRIIGAPGEEGLLTTPVREKPFSLILLDEIEKANLQLLNLFLQVFDEGWLTDGMGRKVSFRNTIIIGTSNAGYKIILGAIAQKIDWALVKEKLIDYIFQQGIFRPEFLNRFDDVVVFKPLTKQNLLDISQLLLNKVAARLKTKGIKFSITEPLKEKIVNLSYDPRFGAREMRRVIQNKVENLLATALLSGKITSGDTVEITPDSKILIQKESF